MIPKVKFEVISLEEMLPKIHDFLSGNHPWSRALLHEYPELEKALEGVADSKKRKALIDDYFRREYPKIREELARISRRFQISWSRVSDSFMTALSEVVEMPWSSKDITARVSMNMICPRYLDKRAFDIYYKDDSRGMHGTNAHEILHFLYFNKWEKVFPKTQKNHREAPHIVWKLSEMVPLAILSDPRIQKVLPHEPHVYTQWRKMVVGGRPLLEQLQEIYDSRKDFADFLRKAYRFVKKYEKEIGRLR